MTSSCSIRVQTSYFLSQLHAASPGRSWGGRRHNTGGSTAGTCRHPNEHGTQERGGLQSQTPDLFPGESRSEEWRRRASLETWEPDYYLLLNSAESGEKPGSPGSFSFWITGPSQPVAHKPSASLASPLHGPCKLPLPCTSHTLPQEGAKQTTTSALTLQSFNCTQLYLP